jgi:glycine betaine catabolism A
MTTPLLDHCPPTLPRRAYTDAAWFAAEQRAIWTHDWVCAGRIDAFPEGQIRRITIAGQSVIVLREGPHLRAFHNICRHRGAELCAADQPHKGKLIRCPYHEWAYATDGRLVSTAFATPTEDFRKEDHGLLPVATKLWNGFLFLTLNPTPGALEPDLGLHALDNWPMDGLQTGHVFETTLNCNWKVFWENYNECLHCPGIHPELCDMVPIYRQGIMAPNEDPAWDGTATTTLKPGAASWTMTGEPCGPVFQTLTEAERATAHNFVTLWPTMYVVAHVDYVRFVTLTPLSPEMTLLHAEWLFPAETLAQPGWDHRPVTDFAKIVMRQDGEACEMNQRGLRNAAYTHGTLMPQEFDIARFHDWVRTRLSIAGETP